MSHLVYNTVGSRWIGGSTGAILQAFVSSVWTAVTGTITVDAGDNIITGPFNSPVTVGLPPGTYNFRLQDSVNPLLVSNTVSVVVP